MTQPHPNRTGTCMCGSVKFTLTLTENTAHVCHCGMCRKWGAGGPAISLDCENVQFQSDATLQWYQSSEWAERGFCNRCGSALFFRLNHETGDYMNVSASALDNQDGITLKDHIYIDMKPPYYDFADKCPRLTEKETLALFQGEMNDTRTN